MKKIYCMGCRREIDTKRERYTHVEDYNCQVIEGESWWHLSCFGKAMNRDLTQLEKAAAVMLGKAATVFNNLPEEYKNETKEFHI